MCWCCIALKVDVRKTAGRTIVILRIINSDVNNKCSFLPIWVFPKIGVKPPKWMVYFMETPMNKWMIWGYHYFGKRPYEVPSMNCHHQQQHLPPSGSQLKAFHCWTYHTTSLEGYQLAVDIGIWTWGIWWKLFYHVFFPSFTHRLGGTWSCLVENHPVKRWCWGFEVPF